MTGAGLATRRPLSRRALLTFLWVGAFVILGLVGLRAHSAEVANSPIVAESMASSSALVAVPDDTIVEGGEHATHSGWLSQHLDLLSLCMLSMLVTLTLIVLFTRRPWLQWRFGRIFAWVVALPCAPARSQPLLLLHSISRI